ncbi:12969_t:CDS:2 [Entrophospora sp. SA101]|nr:12969_t:CDS:2 [Entrophospora sp. SA101]
MIKNISKVKTLEESEKLLKRIYSSHSLFSSEIRLSLEVAIRASAEKILDTFYWERNVSESHISHGMFLDLFVNLFYDGMKYLVDDQKKRDLECLVIEHGKFEAVIDNGKALSDRAQPENIYIITPISLTIYISISIEHCFELLIKLRFLVGKNLEELQDILETPPGEGTSDEEWIIKQNLTPQDILRIKKNESLSQTPLLAFEDSNEEWII